MALNSGTHWGCILRVNVDQAIKQEGWKWLLQNSNSHNFDREIFGGHSTDMKSFREWGFRGSEAVRFSDVAKMCGTSSGQVKRTYFHLNEEMMKRTATAKYTVKDGIAVLLVSLLDETI